MSDARPARGTSDTYGQMCPIAGALDLIGDRWTLLLLRDLAHAPMRFRDLQAINPRLSPNLLTKRLRELEGAGLLRRQQLPPPASATVYALTPATRAAVLPVLHALGQFGTFMASQAGATGTLDQVVEQMRLNAHWVLAKGIDFTGWFVIDFGDKQVAIDVGPTRFEPSTAAPKDPVAVLSLEESTMAAIATGALTIDEAERTGALTIAGDRAAAVKLLDRLSLT
jgi:DNA-binding HxlR family transcriptional regulator